LKGTCTVAEFFGIDQGRGPYLMRSGSSDSKSNCAYMPLNVPAIGAGMQGMTMNPMIQ